MGKFTRRDFISMFVIMVMLSTYVIMEITKVDAVVEKPIDLYSEVDTPTPDTPDVIEKIVVQKVYQPVDFSAYQVDETSESSYWYIYHSRKGNSVFGYDIIELDTPYFDVNKAIGILKKSTGAPKDKYFGILFFKQVPFETYKAFIDG